MCARVHTHIQNRKISNQLERRMSCSESRQVWKAISNKEELLGELGARQPGLPLTLCSWQFLSLSACSFAPGRPSFETPFDPQCTEIFIKKTLTPNKVMHKLYLTVGVQRCYFYFINICTGFVLRQHDSLVGKAPHLQKIYPSAKHGQRHHAGTGDARKSKRATKLTQG